MIVKHGEGRTEYGPGVSIELTGAEVATAIDAWLVAYRIYVSGSRTITVNGELCEYGSVYVDPSGFVIVDGKKISGRGPSADVEALAREAFLAGHARPVADDNVNDAFGRWWNARKGR